MLRKLILFLRKRVMHIDDRSQLEIAIENGLKIGTDCHVLGGCIIDPGHCWLITIGDRVTLAPRVHILAHDASTKRHLGKTLIASVRIGNDVFIGAGTIVLPGVSIGDKAIVGAGSVVTHDIAPGQVAAGNPARIICSTEEYLAKRKNQMAQAPQYDISYTIGQITDEKKHEMERDLSTPPFLGFLT